MDYSKKTRSYCVLITAVLAFLATVPDTHAQEKALKQTASQPQSVFLMPRISKQLKFVITALASRRFSDAEKQLDKMIAAYPWHMESHYFRASLMAIQNRKAEAFSSLEDAVEAGFVNQQALFKDPNLKNIREDGRFAALAEKLIQQTKSQKVEQRVAQAVKGGNALISEQNTVWDKRYSFLKSHFRFNDRKVASATVWKSKSAEARELNTLFRRGMAAGNSGDIYDNRDRKHSTLSQKEFPQLAFTQYTENARKSNIDYGLNSHIAFNAPTLGNSSTAVNSGPFWRSHARLALTSPDGPAKLYLQHLNNHLYIYPAVRDFSAEYGDLLPANTSYILISKGKSGSDRPLLKAAVSILAAFKPEEKDQLIENRRLMPALQMIFRKGQKGILSSDAYLNGKAHPILFDGGKIDLSKMITLANSVRAIDIPPPVALSVLEESRSREGVDDFTRELPEKLFDTPGSIARVIRNTAYEKRIVVSTSKTQKRADETLQYKWVLLQGDPNKVSIKPKDKQGNTAEIRISWHGGFPSPLQRDVKTHRVEIGVFADNGKELSAPSFVNFLYPPAQQRYYDKNGRLLAIDHRLKKGFYTDPRIFPRRDWRDDYSYDENGQLTGWVRTQKSQKSEFSRHGARILEKDALGRPVLAQRVGYLYKRDKSGRLVSTEQPLKSEIRYQYLNDKDLLGIVVKQ